MTTQDLPYSLTLTVGVAASDVTGTKVVDLTPDQVSVEAVLERLEASQLTAADLRSRSVVHVAGDARAACAVYAALVGLSGRYLDVRDSSRVVLADQVAATATGWAVDPRPQEPVLLAQLGADHPQLLSVGLSGALRPDEAATVSFSRRLRFVPASDPLTALLQLIATAALRRRGVDDRLPQLVVGDEVLSGSAREALTVGMDLGALRRAGQELRRRSMPERGALVDAVEPGERLKRLQEAARADMADTLLRLGARRNEESGLWHCPRPQRHTNGDANASMKLTDGRTRCFRCDAERVDPLRLAIDTLGCSVDEAADWLLEPTPTA